MHPTPLTDAYLRQLSSEFPNLLLINKGDSGFSTLLDRAFCVLSLGFVKNYATDFTTTFGERVYLPKVWERLSDQERYLTLRHEAIHMRQFRRFGWLGMGLLYTLPLFPIGFAAGRAYLEWEAYRESLIAIAELRGIDAVKDPGVTSHIVSQFTSAAYGWMWPFPGFWRRRIASVVAQLEDAERATIRYTER